MKKNGNKPKGKRGRRPIHTKRDVEIVRLHVEGVVHPRIAEKYGITRERVRQIVALHNQVPRRTFQRKRRAEANLKEAADRRQRKIQREAKLQALSAAWMRGDSITQIAAQFGMRTPHAANALISYRRSRYPALFPLRKPWVRGNRKPKAKAKPKSKAKP
ncbi:MAG: hypothetical protein P4L99_10695 [Chthoniobacter sp.]|nr:hypothetical protein [Chthoniobacter sp.]